VNAVSWAALVALSAGLCACNSIDRHQTAMNTPVIAGHLAMYTQGSCLAWEPPQVSTATPPAHGRVVHSLQKGRINEPGSRCHGQPVEAWVSTYVPNPGFRGEDRFSLNYTGIWNDAGSRLSTSKDIVVDVR
jgi:hypothetical protein